MPILKCLECKWEGEVKISDNYQRAECPVCQKKIPTKAIRQPIQTIVKKSSPRRKIKIKKLMEEDLSYEQGRVRQLFSKKGLFVWMPIAFMIALLFGKADIDHEPVGRHRVKQKLLREFAGNMSYTSITVLGSVLTFTGANFFILATRENKKTKSKRR